ncbi:MAG: hypothetical protein HZA15_12655 [Nitrospirae bacterium]|nr:hypothetical protein [Nitrospirota bacterium]
MKTKLVIVTIFLISLLSVTCQKHEKVYKGGPYFFDLFVGYGKPFVPAKELSYAQSQNMDAYFMAYYDEQGRIIAFVKYLYKTFEFCDLYYYQQSGGLERVETYKSEREKYIFIYDSNGKRIISETRSLW